MQDTKDINDKLYKLGAEIRVDPSTSSEKLNKINELIKNSNLPVLLQTFAEFARQVDTCSSASSMRYIIGQMNAIDEEIRNVRVSLGCSITRVILGIKIVFVGFLKKSSYPKQQFKRRKIAVSTFIKPQADPERQKLKLELLKCTNIDRKKELQRLIDPITI